MQCRSFMTWLHCIWRLMRFACSGEIPDVTSEGRYDLSQAHATVWQAAGWLGSYSLPPQKPSIVLQLTVFLGEGKCCSFSVYWLNPFYMGLMPCQDTGVGGGCTQCSDKQDRLQPLRQGCSLIPCPVARGVSCSQGVACTKGVQGQ